jgi:hypothetical protein
MPAFTSIAAGVGAAGALAGGLGSLFGGSSGSGDRGSSAAIQAANIQAGASDRANAIQKQMYDEAVARSAPWVKAGTSAVNEYSGLLNLPGYDAIDRTDYLRSTPGYQFQLGQGVEARDRSAASKGMLLSGPQLKAVTKYGQGLADTTYNSLMDRIYGLSGQGQSAAALTGNQGIATGQGMAANTIYGGNAQAQGLYNAYNARESAYGNQQKNLYGGLGMMTNALGKAAPAISNWWNSSSTPTDYSYLTNMVNSLSYPGSS